MDIDGFGVLHSSSSPLFSTSIETLLFIMVLPIQDPYAPPSNKVDDHSKPLFLLPLTKEALGYANKQSFHSILYY